MEIAKGITAADYKKLDLSKHGNPDWDKAFDILNKRLSERYIEPADLLQDAEKGKPAYEKKFGFAILALDCLLIETLQSFYEGIEESNGKSTELFQNFLTQRDNFKQHFKTKDEAKEFYKNFRCGILHQAQTFKNTKVRAIGEMVKRDGTQLTVNRVLFHESVKGEKDIYLQELRKRNDTKLLDFFKKKMDFIVTS